MRHDLPLIRTLELVLALMLGALLPACGGGGTDGVVDDALPVVDGATLAITSVRPTVIQADVNTPLTIDGRGFTPPVTVDLLDENGTPLAPSMDGTVESGGRRIRAEAPIMPDLRGTVRATVRVRNGDGRRAEADVPVEVERPEPEARSIDGKGNNLTLTAMGSADTALRDDVARNYADGIAAPAGAARPSARVVSNAVCAQEASILNSRGATDMFWLWGQFLDHDIDLTPEADPAEDFPIAIPQGDAWFDPQGTGQVSLAFQRSTWLGSTGTDPSNPRRQTTAITAWIDASNVYGSDATRAAALRTLDGTGRLKTSAGGLLPFNTAGLPNAPSGDIPTLFLAGDVRANEQLGLTAMHVLWVREHNRVADEIRARNERLSPDEIYQAARRWVGAEMQVITYREFLPLLLGDGALGPYRGYDETVDASIGVLFSTACYRFGHSMVSDTILRLDAAGNEIADGHLALRDAFFNPSRLVTEGGIDPVLRGFAANTAQELDAKIIDDLRNFLFGPPGAGGLDLAALNIQRGRDHGLADLNACRTAYGLAPYPNLAAMSSDADTVARLEAAYETVDDVDAWVGALCEERVAGALVGPLLQRALSDQFRRLRDGDRFYYEAIYRGEALQQLQQTRLADVIRRNTDIDAELADDVLVAGQRDGGARPPRPRPRALTALQLDALTNSGLLR